ncbi:hypothetical protein SAMN04489735_10253 [Aneurinibacillus thermoaerophilus]|uniref:Uncharacterized protein n=1 Tax=Aneurinibacillus thermoaerophilus TaxID=143495 RepID=A0A1G8CE83_ANETH|nr:hypothetical protein [Aneurinibacillus thermoaerophilus]MED0674172.1 hypothetical protein [Aneurinibacillus thermoaerophilus]MED0680428.1 hypothetical protein [Aneurinibacillus thermoaerophilus]MED0765897.1 hypothetical protein [Aneurinibacillus thermoaerophilus]SDH43747.1 hypothetical protein SAMN04489735_10253 [Aneurinibacillus thermoaerophilus]
MAQDNKEEEIKKEGTLGDVKAWDPLDTPQIAESYEAQRRLGRGAEMPGLYEADKAKTPDGEEERTKDERIASLQQNIEWMKRCIAEREEK